MTENISVEFESGLKRQYSLTDHVAVINFPPIEVAKDGYQRISEYPPLFIKWQFFEAKTIVKGTRLFINNRIEVVSSVY